VLRSKNSTRPLPNTAQQRWPDLAATEKGIDAPSLILIAVMFLLVRAGLAVDSILRRGPERELALGHADPRRSRRNNRPGFEAVCWSIGGVGCLREPFCGATGGDGAAGLRAGHPPITGCAARPGKVR
jgi:hypothetical protein